MLNKPDIWRVNNHEGMRNMLRDTIEMQRVLSGLLKGEASITAVTPMTTGFSNDTYLIEGPDLILRLPPAAGAMLDGHDVVGQARIYAALAKAPGAPAVPRIVHVEDGTDLIGAPFFIMARIAGESVNDIDMQPWFTGAPDAVRHRMCRDWVSAFANLARLSPLEVLGAPVSPEDDLQMWQRFADAAQCPQLVNMIDRLLKVAAPITGNPAVIQGDPKLSNLMWQNERITAMLDFEMALNGEPLADLGYMLFFFASDHHAASRAQKLSGMLTRNEVIDQWEAVSGRSANGVVWHEIAQVGKVAAIVAQGVNMANTGRSDDPRLEVFKQNIGYYLGAMAAMLDGAGY
jgi:aminoglycoside phosphotransferase (APT) family kinase protein